MYEEGAKATCAKDPAASKKTTEVKGLNEVVRGVQDASRTPVVAAVILRLQTLQGWLPAVCDLQ